MTFDVPTPVLVGAALTAAVGGGAYLVRALVLDRLKALEDSRVSMGERFGNGLDAVKAEIAAVKGRLDVRDAVERDRRRRVR